KERGVFLAARLLDERFNLIPDGDRVRADGGKDVVGLDQPQADHVSQAVIDRADAMKGRLASVAAMSGDKFGPGPGVEAMDDPELIVHEFSALKDGKELPGDADVLIFLERADRGDDINSRGNERAQCDNRGG